MIAKNVPDGQATTLLGARNLPGEGLKRVMRRLVSGVSILTSRWQGNQHGMTVNSFVSVSVDPPIVAVTLGKGTRTEEMVRKSRVFGITILSSQQKDLAEIFAGRVPESGDRFQGVELIPGNWDAPVLEGGLAVLVCRVRLLEELPNSTLFLGDVIAEWAREGGEPLVYANRAYRSLAPALGEEDEH